MKRLTRSSIVKIVWEATAVVIEAVVRILGGGQGSAQGEKQNSLITMMRMETMLMDSLAKVKSGFNVTAGYVYEKATSCMAGDGRDWESWVTTKDLSIRRAPNTLTYQCPSAPRLLFNDGPLGRGDG